MVTLEEAKQWIATWSSAGSQRECENCEQLSYGKAHKLRELGREFGIEIDVQKLWRDKKADGWIDSAARPAIFKPCVDCAKPLNPWLAFVPPETIQPLLVKEREYVWADVPKGFDFRMLLPEYRSEDFG